MKSAFTMNKKPIASFSLDLDNKWAYMKTHGDEGWENYPSYFDVVVPRILDYLDRHQMKITFFLVGQDAALEKNHQALRSIVDAGHEIANHSFKHEPWLHLYSDKELEEEIANTEEAIAGATGKRPIGFRGPGFSNSERLMDLLIRQGYEYDATMFNTFLGPLARAYYFLKSDFGKQQKSDRKLLFGKFKDGFRTNRPYFWKSDTGRILEIPVTTKPFFKTPIHASYLIYLATFSELAAKLYLKKSIALCRITGLRPSFLLHPLEFLTIDDAPELGFFPGMKASLEKKMRVMDFIANSFKKHYSIVTMREHARSLTETAKKHKPVELLRQAT